MPQTDGADVGSTLGAVDESKISTCIIVKGDAGVGSTPEEVAGSRMGIGVGVKGDIGAGPTLGGIREEKKLCFGSASKPYLVV